MEFGVRFDAAQGPSVGRAPSGDVARGAAMMPAGAQTSETIVPDGRTVRARENSEGARTLDRDGCARLLIRVAALVGRSSTSLLTSSRLRRADSHPFSCGSR